MLDLSASYLIPPYRKSARAYVDSDDGYVPSDHVGSSVSPSVLFESTISKQNE
jgi:hypothetical protein